ncbi:MAG TPA: metallophosphoesterase family protein [Candidatus Eremiobacteraceae bacterium]|nr:metallophosphoesterase family protein [Candidatus Eremiobacteraceae bacterium]
MRLSGRVAALYDIHANLPALEAVLEEVRKADVEQIVIGGDVLPGPMPRETMATLFALDIPVRFVLGNGDREVLERLNGIESKTLPEQVREVITWTAEQLDPGHEHVLATWQRSVRAHVSEIGDVLFCHATPRNDTEIFTRRTPEERLVPIFGGLGVDIVVCGHTHMQFDRAIGDLRVLNAGSVGMPFGRPGAYWLLLGPDVQLRRTEYDLAAAAARVRATRYPQAEDFAASNIERPPTEEEVLDAWSSAELR